MASFTAENNEEQRNPTSGVKYYSFMGKENVFLFTLTWIILKNSVCTTQ